MLPSVCVCRSGMSHISRGHLPRSLLSRFNVQQPLPSPAVTRRSRSVTPRPSPPSPPPAPCLFLPRPPHISISPSPRARLFIFCLPVGSPALGCFSTAAGERSGRLRSAALGNVALASNPRDARVEDGIVCLCAREREGGRE